MGSPVLKTRGNTTHQGAILGITTNMKTLLMLTVCLAMAAMIQAAPRANPLLQCTKCYNDIRNTIEDCQNTNNDEQLIFTCVEEALKASEDCIRCICDIFAIIFGGSPDECQG